MLLGKRISDAIVAIARKLGATVTTPTGNVVADYLEAMVSKVGGGGVPEPGVNDKGKYLKVDNSTGELGYVKIPVSEAPSDYEELMGAGLYLEADLDGNYQKIGTTWHTRELPVFIGDLRDGNFTDEEWDHAQARRSKVAFEDWEGWEADTVLCNDTSIPNMVKRVRCTLLPVGGNGQDPTAADTRNKTVKGHSQWGTWELVDFPEGLPAVTSDDAGKTLKVDSSGNWIVSN